MSLVSERWSLASGRNLRNSIELRRLQALSESESSLVSMGLYWHQRSHSCVGTIDHQGNASGKTYDAQLSTSPTKMILLLSIVFSSSKLKVLENCFLNGST